jgi:hypothetical protein
MLTTDASPYTEDAFEEVIAIAMRKQIGRDLCPL